MRFLAKHPGAGQFEILLDHLGKGHRRWVVGNYKLIYLVVGDRIEITDIFDARQHPGKMRG